MNILSHESATASHYNKEADSYDSFNEKSSALINQTIEKILKKHKVKSVLDLTCGTGSQVFWLYKSGFQVVGSDINSKMLKLAKEKAKGKKLDINFLKGDMRTVKAGKFDAAITIFNAVGHLTKSDFLKTMLNVGENIKSGGLYIFDIFNLSYLLKDNNITKLTIDWRKVLDDTEIREIQYSTISKNGVLASFDTFIKQQGKNKPKISKSSQTLQVYTAKQLCEMLNKAGFKVLSQCDIDGSRFVENKTERILTIAKKL